MSVIFYFYKICRARSYINIPFTYKERPAVEQWENWRESSYDVEIDRWQTFIEFWMEGGFQHKNNKTHSRCLYSDIDCHPKDVIDFDHFYMSDPGDEFQKLANVLESSQNVEVIAEQARGCVINSVYNQSEFHQGGRPIPELRPQYLYTVNQLHRMMNRTQEVRNKFSNETWLEMRDDIYWDQNTDAPENETIHGYVDPVSQELIRIIDVYIATNKIEYDYWVDVWLAQIVEWVLGDADCTIHFGVAALACEWMKIADNHDEDKITDGEYKYPYPFDQYLQVSAFL